MIRSVKNPIKDLKLDNSQKRILNIETKSFYDKKILSLSGDVLLKRALITQIIQKAIK